MCFVRRKKKKTFYLYVLIVCVANDVHSFEQITKYIIILICF